MVKQFVWNTWDACLSWCRPEPHFSVDNIYTYYHKRRFQDEEKIQDTWSIDGCCNCHAHNFFFVAIMGPVFFTDFKGLVSLVSYPEVQTMWIHVIPGLISMILGTLIVLLWALNPNNLAACRKRKRIMDITITLWLTSLIFGLTTYTLFYT